MSLGASAPLDYIAESLVHPSRKIKEGYEASLVVLDDGKVFTGTLIGQVGDHFLLRSAEDVVLKVPVQRVDEKITQTVSLMPPGLTDSLDSQEFLDLVRFLTEIGKSSDFRVPATETVRVWQALHSVVPLSESSLWESTSGSRHATWSTTFSKVSGVLPCSELQPAEVDRTNQYVIRFQMEVHRPGQVGLQIDTSSKFRLWVEGKEIPVTDSYATAHVQPGSCWVLLMLEAGDPAGSIHVTRRDPPGSAAQSSFKLEL
jgi:putative heme-binding domain-containing protein